MSKNKLEVLAKVLTEKIKNFEKEIKTEDIGKIISIADGIAYVSGLDQAMFGELVLINKKHLGMILSLEIDSVGIVLFSNPNDIKENDLVNRTKQVIAVPYGDQMLGRVIDAMGNPLDNLKELDKSKLSNIFKNAFDIMAREAVNEPLETGILAIDSMVPIGKGQRELIIGDRQTGKTTIAIDTIINQKNKNVICIYVAIGQKNSSLNQIIQKLKKHGAFDYTLIINTAASDLPAMQYIAPYTGITIAEEWMKQGKDVLIIYDDLSKHAIAYRTLSLLLRRPPGREAYPGDIFYIHSQLLERSAKLNKSLGGGSITAFPIIETFANDISAYIPTNVISITDGQIFMISSLFNAGQRPAIDIGFSVSRVGSSAQTQAIKYATSSLKLELAQYFEILDFAQFGSDLDPNTLKILNHGNKVMNIMKQKQYAPINQEEQVFLLLSIKNKLINDLDEKDIFVFKEKLIFAINNDKEYKQVANILKKEKALTNDLELRINNLISNLIDYNFKVEKN